MHYRHPPQIAGALAVRAVAVKTAARQAGRSPLRMREMFVRQRTTLTDALRGHLSEFGFVAAHGREGLTRLACYLAHPDLPALARTACQALLDQIESLDEQVLAQEAFRVPPATPFKPLNPHLGLNHKHSDRSPSGRPRIGGHPERQCRIAIDGLTRGRRSASTALRMPTDPNIIPLPSRLVQLTPSINMTSHPRTKSCAAASAAKFNAAHSREDDISGVSTVSLAPERDLLQRLRTHTAALHAQAERSGIVAAILAAAVDLPSYALYLRNLLPAYHAMERMFQHHPSDSGIAHLALPPIYRTDSILADLGDLVGCGWAESVPLLPSGNAYAARIAWAGRGDGALLVAHAYTRYLADLNGGQILRTRLIRTFGRDFSATAFTKFPAIADRQAFITTLHAALARAARQAEDTDLIVNEAAVAFELNIRLSEEIVAVARASN